jgi:hypothetical protein
MLRKLEQQRPVYIQIFVQRERITQFVYIKTDISGK